MMGINPQIALTVAKIESNFNPNTVGQIGEIGLFQIRPEFVKGFKRKDLFDPHINIMVGLTKIKEAQRACKHLGNNLEFLVCYNAGIKGSKKIKNPSQFPYVKKANKYYNKLNLMAVN